MNTYKFEVSIAAPSKEEAEAKLVAASTLMQKLAAREITKLADVVKNDPVKTSFAKKALGL